MNEVKEDFSNLGLSAASLRSIAQRGFERPTAIQAKIIPAVLTGTNDIVGQAQTGTGKTAAFGLPLIELLPGRARHVQALILVPTRELAIQVAEEIHSLRSAKTLTVAPIYGGQSISLQLHSLRKGVDIVVGTPGRIIDHLTRGSLDLTKISFLILDEADEMLNMGFLEDVTRIIKQTNETKRTMLFSATMPPEIMSIAQRYMKGHETFKVSPGQLTVTQTDQIYFEVSPHERFEALCRIIDIEEEFYGLIFCRTKIDAANVARRLMERGYDADALHGDMSQSLRARVLKKFKDRSITILVATDVAARGIDVHDLTHVINYALPQDPESYVHRIGRTGRAGKEGNAITFVTSAEYRQLQQIQRAVKTDIRRGKLPKARDIRKIKRQRIIEGLAKQISGEILPEYRQMAVDLLSQHPAEEAMAAVLQQAFSDQFKMDADQDRDDAVDPSGRTRLFIKRGQADGMTRSKLVKMITRDCAINPDQIQDVRIHDHFAFVTMPFQEAEQVLQFFKNQGKNTHLPMEKARPKE